MRQIQDLIIVCRAFSKRNNCTSGRSALGKTSHVFMNDDSKILHSEEVNEPVIMSRVLELYCPMASIGACRGSALSQKYAFRATLSANFASYDLR